MRWGTFGRWPIRWGGGRPEAQSIYESMRDGRGERYTRDDSGNENRSLRAHARAIAIAKSYQRRGALQAFPGAALDLLPAWEQRLASPTDPKATIEDRHNTIKGILAGNGPPIASQIIAALRLALGGETVSIAGPSNETEGTRTTSGLSLPGLTPLTTGSLPAGLYLLRVAYVDASNNITLSGAGASATVAASGALLVGPMDLHQVAGAVRIDYYLSVKPGVDPLAFIASGRGDPFVVEHLPTSDDRPGRHHLGIIVSDATFASRAKRARIDAVLGPMLPAHTTYAIAGGGPPFLLDESELGRDAL